MNQRELINLILADVGIEPPAFAQGTTADQIVMNGWTWNVGIERTLDELMRQGFMVNKTAVIQAWVELDERYSP